VPGALAIIQARVSSTRLPGKSIADVDGEPMLVLLLRRLERADEVERIVVATSTEPEDDVVEEVAREVVANVYRGPLQDVLTRFVGAAEGHRGPLVRVTADCPLVDPQVVDEVIRLFERTSGCAYASNVEPRSYPKGLDVEVFSTETLAWADAETRNQADREHVTALVRRSLAQFPVANLQREVDLSALRWTVDTSDDLEFVRTVVARLGSRRHSAGLLEILAAVRCEPSLAAFRGERG
jgi:spore coat polysaccharide biosynthesis protein SpsF (cytidylyltransferase family)